MYLDSESNIKAIKSNFSEAAELAIDETLLRELVHDENVDKKINHIVSQHISCFCKKHCLENRYLYQCTVDASWDRAPSDASLCEWGNGSYDWMVGQLRNLKNQNYLNNKEIVNTENYFRKVVASVPFWERYKNWRFQRRIRVPDYIKVLDRDACRVFWGLYDSEAVDSIAQRLGRNVNEITTLVRAIHQELIRRNRSYLLQKNVNLSLTLIDSKISSDELAELNSYEEEGELQTREKVLNAYEKLSWLEQYILDVMVVDNLSATAVLKVLQEQSISLDQKSNPSEQNSQQVYYFLRKTLLKLKQKFASSHG